MNSRQNYRLPLDNSLMGKIYHLSSFPDLTLKYISLTPDGIMLNVNGTDIPLKSEDLIQDRIHLVDDRYQFQFQVIEADATSISFSVEDQLKVYNLNQPFTINLDENPSTGYTWQVQVTPGLKIVQDTYSHQCKEGILGCGGVRTFILAGIQKGIQTFSAEYKREWETDPIYNRIYKIEIR